MVTLLTHSVKINGSSLRSDTANLLLSLHFFNEVGFCQPPKLALGFGTLGGELFMADSLAPNHPDSNRLATNRLANESSPYLRQHATNPVDWYPWGEEAFERAKAEDKPIILSIGYSACHWCHVMEHESFANPNIARLMNENFISIKVDREERPDLDHIYQNVSQLMTRSGGWPLTVFLTPERKPYFGGTYFPPEDRYGRPGFPKVIMTMAQAYRKERHQVEDNAKRLTEAIGGLESGQFKENKRPTPEALRKVCDSLLKDIDWKNGGFNGAPKFPSTMSLTFLWRYGLAEGFGMPQDATTLALTKMAQGGLYDQLGGGFHRYSVDDRWAVPHFEKMLYDNAVILKLYSEVLVTAAEGLPSRDRELFSEVIADTTRYILREMKSPEGGFYSTQDADSEGHEGKFFTWNPVSIRKVLREEDQARAIELRYGITPEGNFENKKETVPSLARTLEDVARTLGKSTEQTKALLEDGKLKLFNAREQRPKPHRDEKILAGWNGLMVSGLVWAARALRTAGQGALAEEALESALLAMNFVRANMTHGNNRMWSVYKNGQARFNGYLDDYAFCAMAALDLARVLEDGTEIDSLISQARSWIEVVRRNFADREGAGFFFTSDDHEKLLKRPKGLFDQSIPSGNAVVIQCLLALSEIDGNAELEKEADEHLYKFFPVLEKFSMAMGELASSALLYVMGPVTVAGVDGCKAAVHPHIFQKTLSTPSGSSEGRLGPKELLVCHKKTCALPLSDPDDARKLALKKTLFRAS